MILTGATIHVIASTIRASVTAVTAMMNGISLGTGEIDTTCRTAPVD